MAYAVINKTGCYERKGNLQIRFDFFLEKDDPRYSDCLVDVPVSQYDGRVDKDGNPIQKDYDKWFSSVAKVKQLNPFHSHFAYFDPDVTDDEIKAEMDYHLPNFYKAYQDQWDKVQGGMRHGFAVEKRLGCLDYSEIESKTNFELRQSQVNSRLALLADIQSKPIVLSDGNYYPATTIDVGSAAIDGNNTAVNNYTWVQTYNPANDTGTLDTVEIWFNTNATGVKVGTFSGSSSSWDDRDYETIGSVTAGAKRTYTGLSIDVVTDDIIGYYTSTGLLEINSSTGNTIKYSNSSGDKFGSGAQSYTNANNYVLSLYATGDTGATEYECSCTDGLTFGDSDGNTMTLNLSLTDGLSCGDNGSNLAQLYNILSEGLTLSDTASNIATLYNILADGFKLGDNTGAGFDIYETLVAGLIMGDTASHTFQTNPVATDGLKVGVSVLTNLLANESLTDGLALDDGTPLVQAIFNEALSDGLVISESAAAGLVFLLAVADGLQLSDTVLPNFIYYLALTDGLKLGDIAAYFRILKILSRISQAMRIKSSIVHGLEIGSALEQPMNINSSIAHGLQLTSTLSHPLEIGSRIDSGIEEN